VTKTDGYLSDRYYHIASFRPAGEAHRRASNKRPNKKIESSEIKNIKCINDAQPDPILLESPGSRGSGTPIKGRVNCLKINLNFKKEQLKNHLY
jgi:hypothetical protein